MHERLFHGVGAGDDLGVVGHADRPRRRPDLLGEPDAAGALRGLPRRPADLGRADGRRHATAGSPACATSRSSPARSSSRCRSTSRRARSRRTSRSPLPGGQGGVRPRRRGDHRADRGRGDRRTAVRRGGDRRSPTATCAPRCAQSAGSTQSATTAGRTFWPAARGRRPAGPTLRPWAEVRRLPALTRAPARAPVDAPHRHGVRLVLARAHSAPPAHSTHGTSRRGFSIPTSDTRRRPAPAARP